MYYYALVGLLAAMILIIVNYDILFHRSDNQAIPAIGIYRKFLCAVMAYYVTDILWGLLDSLHLVGLLFLDTIIYYIAMAAGVLWWTQYVVAYLAEDNAYSRFLSHAGRIFFAAVTAAAVVNFFTPVLFWFDEAGAYQACPARHAQLLVQIFLLLLTSAYTFRAMSKSEGTARNRYQTIALFGLVVAIHLLVQLKFPFLPLYTIGFLLGTCILHTFVLNEKIEEYRQGLLDSMQRAKDAAEKVSRAKSEFLSNMSHEIRTPINAILGMNEVILRECEDEKILAYSENVRVAGNTLLGLVNDILDFSKIEAGKIEIIPVEYDLSTMLNDLVNMVHVRADDKGLAISLDFDKNTPRCLYGDEVRIKQVITNILTNAVKYTEKGTVMFSVGFDYCNEDTNFVLLHVSVKDTGIGIKPEDMEKLFTKFERIEEKRNRNMEGTGLGLTITKNLLEMMGSSLQVESTYGVGSTFSFTLRQRVLKWDLLGNYKASYHDALLRNRKKYREKFTAPEALVLMVDDNPMNLMVFKSLLKRTKVQIDTADDGDAGLLLTQSKKYDLIFLDHMMPNKDGIETLQELRTQKEGPNLETPAICLTANAISGAREQYIEAGFDDYLTKPVDSGKLEDMLLTYLPKEKIGEASADDENSDADIAIPEALAPLRGQDWIDLSLGIQNSGSADAYMPLLKIFYESLDGSMDKISGYYAAEKWKDYTVKVHALKSSALLIGAVDIAKKAQLLENAGKSGEMEYIRAHHRDFIEECQNFKEPVAEIFAEKESDAEKPVADAELMEGVLEEIRAAAEDLDAERLEAIFSEMEAYRIPEAQSELYEKLKDSAALFDYRGIQSLLGKP